MSYICRVPRSQSRLGANRQLFSATQYKRHEVVCLKVRDVRQHVRMVKLHTRRCPRSSAYLVVIKPCRSRSVQHALRSAGRAHPRRIFICHELETLHLGRPRSGSPFTASARFRRCGNSLAAGWKRPVHRLHSRCSLRMQSP